MRVVSIAPMLPHRQPDNAGERYLLDVYRALPDAEILVIAPRTPRSLKAVHADSPPHLLIPVPLAPRFSALRRLHSLRTHALSVSPHAGLARGLRQSVEARRALAEADVVDLQWANSQLLLPLLRRLAPRARFILTFHDITSQQKRRELAAEQGFSSRVKSAIGLAQARWLERRAHRWADELVVLSEKDRALLPRPERATVMYPPIAAGAAGPASAVSGTASDQARVLFVGPLWREPNRDAVTWLIESVWPKVREAVPHARLCVAGSLPESVAPLVPRAEGVEYAGFVDDLDALYASAAVLVAPLRQGAGVKFKVLEAIARGVPTVLTSVAAEGIGDSVFTPRSFDSADGFAEQLIGVLRDPNGARAEAADAARWAARRYGWPQFERRVKALYGPPVPGHDSPLPAPHTTQPSITVVIPTRDGATMLPDQLDAAAHDSEAADIEVVISDNGSQDRTVTVARAYSGLFGSLRVVDSSTVAGVGHARNVGAQAAGADRVVFIDADDEIRPGFIRAIRAALDTADAAAGLPVTGRLGPIDPDGPISTSPLRRAPFGTLEYGVGCALGVRTATLLRLGGFDESFTEGHEEVEFCWRLQLSGGTIVGVPDAVVDYRQRPAPRSSFRQMRRYARSAEHLRSRYVHSLSLPPTTVKRTAKILARTIVTAPRELSRHGAISVARRLGWALGALEGTIRFRHASPPIGTQPPLVVSNGASAADSPNP